MVTDQNMYRVSFVATITDHRSALVNVVQHSSQRPHTRIRLYCSVTHVVTIPDQNTTQHR